jgi:hypothetical protein
MNPPCVTNNDVVIGVLNDGDGVKGPLSICFNKSCDKLYMTSENSRVVHVFACSWIASILTACMLCSPCWYVHGIVIYVYISSDVQWINVWMLGFFFSHFNITIGVLPVTGRKGKYRKKHVMLHSYKKK